MIRLFLAPLDLPIYSDERYLSEFLNIPFDSMCHKRQVEKTVAQNILLKYLNTFMFFECEEVPSMVKNEFGKPYFKEKVLPYFNISHTRDLLVVAIADSEIGVDIETINSRRHINDISNRFFNSSEQNYVNEYEKLSQDRFFLLWVLRESISKYIGKGFVSFEKDFHLFPTEGKVVLGESDITKYIYVGDVCYTDKTYKISVVSRNTDSIEYFGFDGLCIKEINDDKLLKVNLSKLSF